MPRGRPTRLTIRLTEAERLTLDAWLRATTMPAGRVRRARIIVLVAEGRSITDVARTVGISRHHVYKWVTRFVAQGVEGLLDQARHGAAQRQWRGEEV